MMGASNTSYKYGTPVALQRSLSPNPTPNSNPNSSPTPATYRSSNHVVIITLFRKACALKRSLLRFYAPRRWKAPCFTRLFYPTKNSEKMLKIPEKSKKYD
eukprot:sb/3478472/